MVGALSQNAREWTAFFCALGAIVLAVAGAVIGDSDSLTAGRIGLFLAVLAAVLGGVAARVLMPNTAWRFVVVPFVALVVFLVAVALLLSATGE